MKKSNSFARKAAICLMASMLGTGSLYSLDANGGTTAALQAAQSKSSFTASGVITDEEGEPLAGVVVTVSGTKKSVLSDVDGRFSIPDIKAGQQLDFSFWE